MARVISSSQHWVWPKMGLNFEFSGIWIRTQRKRQRWGCLCSLAHQIQTVHGKHLSWKGFLQTAATSKPQIFLDIWKNVSWLIKDYRTYWILYLAKSNGASLIFQDHKLHLWWADVSFAEKCTTQSIFKISKPLVGWCQGSPKFLLPVVLVWGTTELLNWKIEIYYFDHLKLPDKADKEAVFIVTS